MTKNGLFVLGGPETQLHDILWAVHDGKNHGSVGEHSNLKKNRTHTQDHGDA